MTRLLSSLDNDFRMVTTTGEEYLFAVYSSCATPLASLNAISIQ